MVIKSSVINCCIDCLLVLHSIDESLLHIKPMRMVLEERKIRPSLATVWEDGSYIRQKTTLFVSNSSNLRVVEMAQRLSTCWFFRGPELSHQTHVKQFSKSCNSSSVGSDVFFDLSWHIHSHAHRSTVEYIHNYIPFKTGTNKFNGLCKGIF